MSEGDASGLAMRPTTSGRTPFVSSLLYPGSTPNASRTGQSSKRLAVRMLKWPTGELAPSAVLPGPTKRETPACAEACRRPGYPQSLRASCGTAFTGSTGCGRWLAWLRAGVTRLGFAALALLLGLLDPVYAGGPALTLADDVAAMEGQSGSMWRHFVVVPQGHPHSAVAGQGRFVSRDPYNASLKMPEAMHPYSFGHNNPPLFSDPTGLFTIVEISSTQVIQTNLRQAVMKYAREEIKDRVKEQIYDSLEGVFAKAMNAFIPKEYFDPIQAILAYGAKRAGNVFESATMEKTLESHPNGGSGIYWQVAIDRQGDPRDDSIEFSLKGMVDRMQHSNDPRPDFVAGQVPPTKMGGQRRAYFCGDIKLSGATLAAKYKGDQQGQFEAIARFTQKHSMTNMAVFLTYWTGSKADHQALKELLRDAMFSKGVIMLLISAKQNKG